MRSPALLDQSRRTQCPGKFRPREVCRGRFGAYFVTAYQLFWKWRAALFVPIEQRRGAKRTRISSGIEMKVFRKSGDDQLHNTCGARWCIDAPTYPDARYWTAAARAHKSSRTCPERTAMQKSARARPVGCSALEGSFAPQSTSRCLQDRCGPTKPIL